MSEITVTADNFEEEVLKSDKPVLIDFWAAWCGPCRRLAPIVAEIADEHTEIKVCKINIDDEMQLAMDYNVASIPTLVVMKDGKAVKRAVGVMPKEQILEMF
ncbi:MAG: thioredoxin [Lachnospiraceae bacterium]|nr:thioredoxin [Candidatus Colinaster scatohippi]